MKYMHTIGLQIAGLYCQPFFSQFSKAKTSKGHFQSQIDHSTQGKPLKKASRRPREQNASLCSGRVHTQDWLWSAAWPQVLYSFPLQNPDLLNKWLAKMKRKGFVPTKSSRLCSGHFLDTCFQEDLYAKYVGVAKFLNVEPT